MRRNTRRADQNKYTAKQKPAELTLQISAIEREIVEHLRPAAELNRELRAYLGRDELQFARTRIGWEKGPSPSSQLM